MWLSHLWTVLNPDRKDLGRGVCRNFCAGGGGRMGTFAHILGLDTVPWLAVVVATIYMEGEASNGVREICSLVRRL